MPEPGRTAKALTGFPDERKYRMTATRTPTVSPERQRGVNPITCRVIESVRLLHGDTAADALTCGECAS